MNSQMKQSRMGQSKINNSKIGGSQIDEEIYKSKNTLNIGIVSILYITKKIRERVVSSKTYYLSNNEIYRIYKIYIKKQYISFY